MKRVVRWMAGTVICVVLLFFVWWVAVYFDYITLTFKPFSNERLLYVLGPVVALPTLMVSLFVRLLCRRVPDAAQNQRQRMLGPVVALPTLVVSLFVRLLYRRVPDPAQNQRQRTPDEKR